MHKVALALVFSLAIALPAHAQSSGGSGKGGMGGGASSLRQKCEALVRKHNPGGTMRRGERENAINRCIANGGRVQ